MKRSHRRGDGVEELGVDLALLDRGRERRAVEARRSGHLEVEPRFRRGDGAAGGHPVGHDDAVEAPLAAQHVGQEPAVLGAPATVEPVVRGHRRQGAALTDAELERDEVQLAQRALVDVGAHRRALELALVADEVLHRRGDASALHAAHEGRRRPARQQRVLGVALEVAAGGRRAVQVDGGGEEDPGALRARLLAEGGADLLDERRDPTTRRGRCRTGSRRR